MGLSSPNRMVWQYFEALRRLAAGAVRSGDETSTKQDAAVCIMLAVTVVEAFLNSFFRVVVSEPGFAQHKDRILNNLRDRRGIEHKLTHWTKDVLGNGLDPESPTFKSFIALQDRRNALMHFTSSHETVSVPDFQIQGLADTSVFDSLTANDATEALAVAEAVVSEVFRLHGYTEEQVPYGLQLWTGKVPIN